MASSSKAAAAGSCSPLGGRSALPSSALQGPGTARPGPRIEGHMLQV